MRWKVEELRPERSSRWAIFVRRSRGSPGANERMTVMFQKTVSAICDSIVRSRCAPEGDELASRHAEVVRFVLDQHGRMPDYLRLPLRLATVLFGLLGIAHSGRPFHAQPPPARWRQLAFWRDGPVAPARDLVRFYESLVVYEWYSDHD